MKKYPLLIVLGLLIAGCSALPTTSPKTLGATANPNSTVTIVSSTGSNIATGTASATTALPNQTVRVVNSSNQVLDTLGTGGGGTNITAGAGDFSACTQTGASLNCTVVNSQGNALTSTTFGASLNLSTNTSLSATNITTGTLPNARISGWPITAYFPYVIGGSSITMTANKYVIEAFVLQAPLSFGHLSAYVGTADASHNSDFCLWNSSGTLLADAGAQAISSTAFQTLANTQGTVSLNPGTYWMGITSAASTLVISGTTGNGSIYYATGFGTSSGGACANITPPSVTASLGSLLMGLFP